MNSEGADLYGLLQMCRGASEAGAGALPFLATARLQALR